MVPKPDGFCYLFWCCHEEHELMKQHIATQAGLSLLRKVNANKRVLLGNIATLAEALKLLALCQGFRVLGGGSRSWGAGKQPNHMQFSFIVLIIYHTWNGWVNKVKKLFCLISFKSHGRYPGTNKHLKFRLYLFNVLENVYNAVV